MMYGMWGSNAQSWITFQGKVLIHNDKGELEFLFPGVNIRPIMGVKPEESMPVKDHPDCAGYRWPIRKADFW